MRHQVPAEHVCLHTRHSRNFIDRPLPVQCRHHAFPAIRNGVSVEQVDFVQHQPSRPRGQCGTETLELPNNSTGRLSRVAAVNRRNIHEMQQHAVAGQVLEKANTQTRTLRRAFDQTRDISHHERPVCINRHHPQAGNQRGERVVRHLGCRCRHRANKGRLAGIG